MQDTLERFRLALQPPYLTAAHPGLGGMIKQEIDDFEVEEIPAYLPCGAGDFLFLWIEKRDMGAAYFERQVAQRLGIASGDVGTAGLKDRRAVARQWVSVPRLAEDRVAQLEGEGIRVLQVSRHANKLRAGHLHGNRFRILIRQTSPNADVARRLEPILDLLRRRGVPNFYGLQRFGRGHETLLLGCALLAPQDGDDRRRPRSPFLRRLALSAVQSGLFNLYLAQRMSDALLDRVLPGDVMAKLPRGGMFVAQEIEAEQARFDCRETVHAGPIFGVKTFAAQGEARRREDAILHGAGFTPQSFASFRKLMQGTRRHNLVYLDDLDAAWHAEGLRLSFSLPAGSYATVVLREIMKNPEADAESEA